MTDTLAIVRSLGALLTLLGCLAGALWAVRRFNLVLPGAGQAANRRLAVVERLSLDPRRSIALLRSDDMEHLVLMAPEGHLVIQSRVAKVAIVAEMDVAATGDKPDSSMPAAAPAAGVAASVVGPFLSRIGSDFGRIVDRAYKPALKPVPLPARKPNRKPVQRSAAGRAKSHA